MFPIPQELQDAWDKAQQALADDETASNKLFDLENDQAVLTADLAQAKTDAMAKAALLDQARLNFDQLADRLLTVPDGSTTPQAADPNQKPNTTSSASSQAAA